MCVYNKACARGGTRVFIRERRAQKHASEEASARAPEGSQMTKARDREISRARELLLLLLLSVLTLRKRLEFFEERACAALSSWCSLCRACFSCRLGEIVERERASFYACWWGYTARGNSSLRACECVESEGELGGGDYGVLGDGVV